MSIAVEAEHLTKIYKIGGAEPETLRELFRGRGHLAPKRELSALDDVSLTIEEGDTFAIIGRNGAGKSTLLKILSRITRPTKGYARIYGRVGTLLEVGTGFHGELSGRENVYLNGAILGMSRAEIDSKFDEIVAFSEMEMFLDTPVKRYSTGMYMRLAFSVAAHLETDILIVDEVLAVGDIGFQNKCLGKMDEVRRSGRTIIFVSHNLGSLAQVCRNGIVLDHGRLVFRGNIRDSIEEYLKYLKAETEIHVETSDIDIAIASAAVTDDQGRPASQIFHDQGFAISFRGRIRRHRRGSVFGLALLNKYKRRVFTEHKLVEELLDARTGEFSVTFQVPGNYIAPNNYSFMLQTFMPGGETLQELNDICPFEIVDAGSDMVNYPDHGYIVAKGEWHVGLD